MHQYSEGVSNENVNYGGFSTDEMEQVREFDIRVVLAIYFNSISYIYFALGAWKFILSV